MYPAFWIVLPTPPLDRMGSIKRAFSQEGVEAPAGPPIAQSDGGKPLSYVEEYVIAAVAIVRKEPTAYASFATIFERRRLGIAIAAMIRMSGIITMPTYPSTKPAVASPESFSRPALLRMSACARCPRTIAAIAAGKIKKRIPQVKLATAYPLFSPGSE